MLERVVIFCVICISLVVSRCPNSCSGHGSCGPSNLCTCYPQWDGGAADCSQRICPSGTAWADKAYAADAAHQEAECSNAGICNRQTGNCECFPGFTGNACQRSSCPADCSGHGICSTIGDVSLYEGPDYDSTVTFAGDGLGPAYSNWDKNSIQLCECDPGFFGADCSLAKCPKGDDPLTINQNYRSILLTVASTGSYDLEGQLGLNFMGETVMLTLSDATTSLCTNELAFHGPFGHALCSVTQLTRLKFQFTFTFYSWPTYPKTNNLFSHDGNPSKYDFYCDTTHVTAFTTCVFTDIEASNIQEYVYCSNRGLCNFDTGDCKCNEGFGGPACSNVTYLHHHGSNTLPGMQVNANSLDYTSSVIQINSQKSKASDFNMIEAIAGGEVVFFVRGDGTVSVNKLLAISGGQTVSGGGLFVEGGGVTIATKGLSVYSEDQETPVALLSSTYTGPIGSSYSALRLKTFTSTPSQARAIEVLSNGGRRFAVRADGNVIIYQAGMSVTGGITLNSGGLKATGGATINSGGLRVAASGMTATGGITVYTSGLDVMLGGLEVYSGGASIYSGGLKVIGGHTINSGGFTVTGGVSIGTMGLRVTGGVTIYTRGVTVKAGGGTIESGGLYVTADGLTVFSGGARITGGLSVTTDGLQVTGGATVVSGGAVVTAGGATVTAGGLVVRAGGIATTGGLTVQTLGAFITGGLTVNSAGATVVGGLTVSTLGVVVTQSGVTISAGGLSIGGNGLTVVGGGLSVTAGGLSVANGGLRVTGGLTLYTNGMIISSGGLTISTNGLKTSGGITVDTAGVVVTTGGLTVSQNGVVVSNGGLTVSNGGLSITNTGLSVAGGGARVTNGVTVHTGGLLVALNGVTVTSGGVAVGNTGLTVTSGGVVVTNNGLSVTNGGLRVVNDGATVYAGGLRVNLGGLSVIGGAVISNGLTVYGDLYVSSSITTFTSDRRLKRDIVPIDDPLAKINKLNGVYFKWIQDEPNGIEFDTDRHVGMLAQEVQSVLPEVVMNIHGGKYLGVNYANMIPLVIEAIRELDKLFVDGKISSEEKEKHTTEMFSQILNDVQTMDERLRIVEEKLGLR